MIGKIGRYPRLDFTLQALLIMSLFNWYHNFFFSAKTGLIIVFEVYQTERILAPQIIFLLESSWRQIKFCSFRNRYCFFCSYHFSARMWVFKMVVRFWSTCSFLVCALLGSQHPFFGHLGDRWLDEHWTSVASIDEHDVILRMFKLCYIVLTFTSTFRIFFGHCKRWCR